jgi:hypothetical protein
MRGRVTVALVALLMVGCGSSQQPAQTPAQAPTASAGSARLATGKTDLPLDAGVYGSPEGFTPDLAVTVPSGWTSVHRGADGFDFGKPDPNRDAPLVAVVVMRPAEATAVAALAAVRARATGTVRPAGGQIGTVRADGFDVDGGSGQLVASADGGIALDAAKGQRIRVLAADVGGEPLMVAVLVPDGSRFDAAWTDAAALVGGLAAA